MRKLLDTVIFRTHNLTFTLEWTVRGILGFVFILGGAILAGWAGTHYIWAIVPGILLSLSGIYLLCSSY